MYEFFISLFGFLFYCGFFSFLGANLLTRYYRWVYRDGTEELRAHFTIINYNYPPQIAKRVKFLFNLQWVGLILLFFSFLTWIVLVLNRHDTNLI